MACGGRVTKGGGMVVAIPFDATDVENLVVSVYTNGDEKIEKSGDDIRIGEGIIYVDMSKTDVDLLADGVVSYTMDYEIDGVQYSENGGTTNYIKTPKDYSATSITEVVQSAYTEGHEVGYQEGYEAGRQEECPECSGGTSCNLQAKSQPIDGSGTGLWNIYPDAGYDGMESVTILDDGYGEAKYEEGHAQGKQDGEAVGYDEAVSTIRSQSISLSVSANGTYSANTQDSIYFNEVNVNVPQSSGSSCNLQSGNLSLPPEGVGIWTLYPEEGYDGFSYFQVVDNGYAESYWEQGYGSGFESGYTTGYREFQNGLTSFSFGPEQVVASGQGSFTYTNASGWSSVTIGMPLVYSCRIIFANISNLPNILDASDVTDIRFGYETLTQSDVIVGDSNIVIYGTPTYDTGRFEGISFAIPTSIFNQISSWNASALSLNGYKSNLNDYIGGIVFTPYRTRTWQSGDKTFISVSTFNFDN